MKLRFTKSLPAACVVALAVLSACSRSGADIPANGPMFTVDHGQFVVPEKSPMRSHLTVQPVLARGGARKLSLPAVVEADPARVVNVMAPLTGKLEELRVGLGDTVKKGQLLAVVASGDLAQAYADDDKARDAAELARKTLERTRGVRDAGAAARKDFEAAESAYAQAEAERLRARQRLESFGGKSGAASRNLVLTAPADGTITALSVGKGGQVDDPTATLMTIANVERVFVTANVPENEIASVAPGLSVDITLNAYPDQHLSAKVTTVSALVEPDTRRQKVRIALPNPDGRLKPNMYATVQLDAAAPAGVFVPQSALLMNNDVISVLVEVQPWTFERRQVDIGDEEGDEVRVLHGLREGDRVVIKGGVLLND